MTYRFMVLKIRTDDLTFIHYTAHSRMPLKYTPV